MVERRIGLENVILCRRGAKDPGQVWNNELTSETLTDISFFLAASPECKAGVLDYGEGPQVGP